MDRLLLFILLSISSGIGYGSTSLELGESQSRPIGEYARYFQETGSKLSLQQAIKRFESGDVLASENAVITRGVGVQPVWLKIQLHNRQQQDVVQRLSIETSWLDDIELYLTYNNQVLKFFHGGDTLPFGQRQTESRFFQYDLRFNPGSSTLYIRVATADPMVIPIYLTDLNMAYERKSNENYFYGWVYGVVFGLMGFNLMLFFSLGSRRYLFYSAYLASFIMMNMTYTGHAYQWLWPQSPGWQLWANHLLIFMFPVLGLLFATEFLKTRYDFPRLHKLILFGSAGFTLLVILGVLLKQQAFTLIIVFIFIFFFSVMMVYMGLSSYISGNKSAKYFLIASITHVVAATITMFTTSAIIPYSQIGYHAVEIGIVLDAILLAMALADQLRLNQEQKLKAEQLAKIDPLTGVNNRRAFYDLVEPLWTNSIENKHGIAVIILDIDKFKSINDQYGHGVGDKVLTEIAHAINDCIRISDIMARWGGEEFIILLPNTPMHAAVSIAKRVCQTIAIRKNGLGSGVEIAVTASVGVAHTNESIRTLDTLVAEADKHLYKAKNSGGNQVCCEEHG